MSGVIRVVPPWGHAARCVCVRCEAFHAAREKAARRVAEYRCAAAVVRLAIQTKAFSYKQFHDAHDRLLIAERALAEGVAAHADALGIGGEA